jgi:hypothetical protein
MASQVFLELKDRLLLLLDDGVLVVHFFLSLAQGSNQRHKAHT